LHDEVADGLAGCAEGAGVAVNDDEPEVTVSSLQPHHPRDEQDSRERDVDVLVVVSVVAVVVVGSLQPNQPGVWHTVVVGIVTGMLVEEGKPLVAVGSRQPHQPGVLQVSVLVFVNVADELDVLVVVVPLLSKYFHA